MNYYTSFIVCALFLYEAFTCFVQKKAVSPKKANRYTKESIAKFSVVAGCAFLAGGIMEWLFTNI